MRITNKMMTNNMMSNINKNKLNMNSLEEQYSSGKKIQKPSDDPIIAVRALKLRTNLSELTQYYEKNIPDAKNWMDVSESALTTVNDVLSQINTYCVQGSTDTLTPKDRSYIAENLGQLKQQIYQEGNTNYAGRYVFTGYKTDSSLLFEDSSSTISYTITQNIPSSEIQSINKVTGSYTLDDFDDPANDLSQAPQMQSAYRIQLAYSKLDSTPPTSIRYFKDGVEQTPITSNINSVSSTDTNAYTPGPDDVNYIADTGELILGSNVYASLRTADNMKIEYSKTGFEKGDLKPEHYFDCTMSDSAKPELGTVTYTKADSQPIQYEVNFNQKLTINTEASNSITHDIGRTIDNILQAVNDVTNAESKLDEVNKRLADPALSQADKDRYTKLKDQFTTELQLKKEVMQKAFSSGNTVSTKQQDKVNTAVADLGSRAVRLGLIENRLSSQQVDFTDLMSKNEDADVVETYIKYGSAQTIYNASLSAASKIVKNTLLDYL